jgi:hypothetical protein
LDYFGQPPGENFFLKKDTKVTSGAKSELKKAYTIDHHCFNTASHTQLVGKNRKMNPCRRLWGKPILEVHVTIRVLVLRLTVSLR